MTFMVEGPGWAKEGLEHASGRYPLRVEAPVLRTVELLVPGISSVTRYVRYYALYAALAAHADEHDLDAAACRRLLRRGEVVLAGVSIVHDDPDGWPGMAHGVDRVRPLFGDDLDLGRVADLDDGDRSYSPRAWGFWEQYGGPNATLGTVTVDGGALRPAEHPCPAEVRELFAPLWRAADQDLLDGPRLDELAALAMQRAEPPEVPWLRGLFTATVEGRHDPGGWAADDRRRRAAFRMFGRAVVLHGHDLEQGPEEWVRSAVAFGDQIETDPVLRDLDHVLAWRGLMLRNYSVSAWRRLWAGLVGSMGPEDGSTDRDRDELRAWLADKMPAGSLRAFLDELPDTMDGGHPTPLEREILANADPKDPLVDVRLLLVGGRRATELVGEERTTFLGTRHDILNPLWVDRLIHDFTDRPMTDLAVRLVDDMLAQARRVALAKMRPDRNGRMKVFSRVHERAGRFYKTGDEGDGDIGLRILQLADFAHQLGLVTVTSHGTAAVTPLGVDLLEVGP
ncbi:hypothetical protein [Thermomonospora umbrina]|uniref:Uncharacterized protein n=1 Tax=Thermomonospora umbrina TaxID=111806 RepID=A0A3D9SMK2_9ACTN|nr:hypothetical protein [Thermomonospora umbrina]REE95640.1 hypothetical protein DFJ69_1048 [Thermomonospora umbrina]